MKKKLILAVAIAFSFLATGPVLAQAVGGAAQWEGGVSVGKLLPNQISGVTEIMSLGGLHLGYQLADMTYVQTFYHMGKGEGQSWKNLGLSFRLDQPAQDFILSAYAGISTTLYKGGSNKEHSEVGGHVGGAAMTGIGGPTWLKGDMNFSFGPGTSLLISLALLLRY